jgi:2,3-bisphosphoglycerate-dependent phosphoglycerate mutase
MRVEDKGSDPAKRNTINTTRHLMALLLIRHGETAFNATRVMQFPDTPLSTTGLQQAERLAQRLAAHSLEMILTSDYLRARSTAEHIAAAAGVSIVHSPNLRERNFGDLRGQSYETFGNQDVFARDYHPPGGESWSQFDLRVDRAWEELLAYAAGRRGDIAIVTHGLVLRSLIERWLDTTQHAIGAELVIANTSVTVAEPMAPWRVLKLGCTEHLEQLADNIAPA